MKQHIMLRWAEVNGKSLEDIAKSAGCSVPHLYNVFSGRREPSLSLAKRLADVTDGVVPMDAFLKPQSMRA